MKAKKNSDNNKGTMKNKKTLIIKTVKTNNMKKKNMGLKMVSNIQKSCLRLKRIKAA